MREFRELEIRCLWLKSHQTSPLQSTSSAFFYKVPAPACDSASELATSDESGLASPSADGSERKSSREGERISFWEALRIPKVITYAVCYACCKSVNWPIPRGCVPGMFWEQTVRCNRSRMQCSFGCRSSLTTLLATLCPTSCRWFITWDRSWADLRPGGPLTF